MRRDLQLCRVILLAIEALEPRDSAELKIEGHTAEEVKYHIGLLADGGYLDSRTIAGETHAYAVVPYNLRWKGHDFLDAVRDPEIWEASMKKAGGRAANAGLDIAKELCVALIKGTLGLPS